MPTRQVFENIAPWMQVAFYSLIFSSLAVSGLQLLASARRWRRGVPGELETRWRVWLRRLAADILGQQRVRRRSLGGLLHACLFSGFLVLAIGTTLLFLSDKGPVHFHRGTYFLFYELTMDVFGAVFVAGCLLALYRRVAARPASLGHDRVDILLLVLLLAIALTGFMVEALRLRWDGTPAWVARWSVVGSAIASGLLAGEDPRAAREAHVWTWWLHVFLIATFFATFLQTRFRHVLTGSLNILTRPSRPAGALPPVSLEEVETTGRIGIAGPADLTRQQLLSLDACMECGRCEDACPAFATGKPLSPRALIQDLRHGRDIGSETLWACTMCQACVFECPVLIAHVDLVAGMRRHRVGEGELAGPPAQALRRLGGQANPFGQPPADRMAWAEGLDVPTTAANPDFDILLWVGCAAAYDPRAQRVARATVRLLQRAGVNFAVLGKTERCTGDPARRLGDEMLFQQLAGQNGAELDAAGCRSDREPEAGDGAAPGPRRRIVTPCPHCMNSFRNDYAQLGGGYDVAHHSQFLAELVAAGRLQRRPGAAAAPLPATVTLHDPCYLARVNSESSAPRALIAASLPAAPGAESPLREMPRHGARTFCCGAGGGRMWFEERPEQRVNRVRAAEAVATGADALVTACPFCLNMMTDGMATSAGGDEKPVLDVAELLLASLGDEES